LQNNVAYSVSCYLPYVVTIRVLLYIDIVVSYYSRAILLKFVNDALFQVYSKYLLMIYII